MSDGYNTDGICELEEQLGAVDLGDSSLSEAEDFELAVGLSAGPWVRLESLRHLPVTTLHTASVYSCRQDVSPRPVAALV